MTFEDWFRKEAMGFPATWDRENEEVALKGSIKIEGDTSSLETVASIKKGDTILPVNFRVEGSDEFASEVIGKIQEIVNTELVKITTEETIAA